MNKAMIEFRSQAGFGEEDGSKQVARTRPPLAVARSPLFRRTCVPNRSSAEGDRMYRALGATVLLAITFTAPLQDAAAQDPNPIGGARCRIGH